MNSEILEEVLDHPIFDQYNEELNATQINMAYYDAMRRNARSVQTAAYAQARINECKEKLAAIDAQIEEAVYTLAEEYELNENFGSSIASGLARVAMGRGAQAAEKGLLSRAGSAVTGGLRRAGAKMTARAESGAAKAALSAGEAGEAKAGGGLLNRAKKAWGDYTHAGTTPQRGEGGRITEYTRDSIKPRLAATFGAGTAVGVGAMAAANRLTGGGGPGVVGPGGPTGSGGPGLPPPPGPGDSGFVGPPAPGRGIPDDPTEGPTKREKARQARQGGYRYPSSNEKFSKAVTKAAYRNKLVGPGVSPDKIQVGQKLKIGGKEVTVQKGDTLSGLVQKSRIAKKAGQAGQSMPMDDHTAGQSRQYEY